MNTTDTNHQDQCIGECRKTDGGGLVDRIDNAKALLWDYDGHYDRETGIGDATALANLIDEVYVLLNGNHWSESKPKGLPEIDRLIAENRALRIRCETSEYYWDRANKDRNAMRRKLEESRSRLSSCTVPHTNHILTQ